MKANKIPQEMVAFIRDHHVMAMASSQDDSVSSCSLFYSFLEEERCFVFASDDATEHIQNILENPQVSAVIHYETKEIAAIKGIQIKGIVEEAQARHRHLYLSDYPYAEEIKNKSIWKLMIRELKYTDNALGFGKKVLWKA